MDYIYIILNLKEGGVKELLNYLITPKLDFLATLFHSLNQHNICDLATRCVYSS